jgi:uncharacterized protein (DUF2062 family)
MTEPPEFAWSHIGEWVRSLVDWSLALGKPLLVGLVTLALSLATLGWIAVQIGWRLWVVVQWRRRKLRRSGS